MSLLTTHLIIVNTTLLKIFNQENEEPIILLANNAIPTRFEKVALIPYKKSLYTILSPIDNMPGVKENETIVLKIVENKDNHLDFNLPTSSRIINKIYKIYEKNNLETQRAF